MSLEDIEKPGRREAMKINGVYYQYYTENLLEQIKSEKSIPKRQADREDTC